MPDDPLSEVLNEAETKLDDQELAPLLEALRAEESIETAWDRLLGEILDAA